MLLADHGGVMPADDYFADLYKTSRLGRPTVPARTLATVTILQVHEGLSDQEACDRLERDLAWCVIQRSRAWRADGRPQRSQLNRPLRGRTEATTASASSSNSTRSMTVSVSTPSSRRHTFLPSTPLPLFAHGPRQPKS